MSSDQPTEEAQKTAEALKTALWYRVGQIVDEETIGLGVQATPQFIGSLTELVWAQIANVSVDLEAFAEHAGRNTIKIEDVMLLTRRNEGLAEIMAEVVKNLKEEKENQKVKN